MGTNEIQRLYELGRSTTVSCVELEIKSGQSPYTCAWRCLAILLREAKLKAGRIIGCGSRLRLPVGQNIVGRTRLHITPVSHEDRHKDLSADVGLPLIPCTSGMSQCWTCSPAVHVVECCGADVAKCGSPDFPLLLRRLIAAAEPGVRSNNDLLFTVVRKGQNISSIECSLYMIDTICLCDQHEAFQSSPRRHAAAARKRLR
jgi:hypothetical protein